MWRLSIKEPKPTIFELTLLFPNEQENKNLYKLEIKIKLYLKDGTTKSLK